MAVEQHDPMSCDLCGGPLTDVVDGACGFCGLPVPTAAARDPSIDVVLHDPGPNRAAVIRLVADHSGRDVAEVEDLVDDATRGPVVVCRLADAASARPLLDALARSGAAAKARRAPVTDAGAAPSDPALAARVRYDVVLHDAGPNRMLAVAAVRDTCRLTATEARRRVDAADADELVVGEALSWAAADAAVARLADVGADASFHVHQRRRS